MLTKSAYIDRRTTALRVLDTEISRLTDYAEEATNDIADEYEEAIRGLQTIRDKATVSLQNLGTVDENEWERQEATRQLEADWNELRNALLIAISATYNERVES